MKAQAKAVLPRAELDELEEMARKAGYSLSDAFRHGARLFLAARLAEPTRRGRPPKREKAVTEA